MKAFEVLWGLTQMAAVLVVFSIGLTIFACLMMAAHAFAANSKSLLLEPERPWWAIPRAVVAYAIYGAGWLLVLYALRSGGSRTSFDDNDSFDPGFVGRGD